EIRTRVTSGAYFVEVARWGGNTDPARRRSGGRRVSFGTTWSSSQGSHSSDDYVTKGSRWNNAPAGGRNSRVHRPGNPGGRASACTGIAPPEFGHGVFRGGGAHQNQQRGQKRSSHSHQSAVSNQKFAVCRVSASHPRSGLLR